MKTLPESLLAFVLALAVGCNKDKTEPTGTNTDFEVEASETIGPEGGSIETEGFVFTVPADAFGSETELVLSSAIDKETFGDNMVSRMYKIEGIPAGYDKPLKVKIKYEGTLYEESYIAIGEEMYVPSIDSLTNVHLFIETSDSLGWLLGEISLAENYSGLKKSSSEQGFIGYTIGCITGYNIVLSRNDHFLLQYPRNSDINYDDVVELGNYLEDAYSFFSNKNKKKFFS